MAHPRLNPNFEREDDKKFDLGTVAHRLILGKGADYVAAPFADWRKKAAQMFREQAIGTGATPILEEQLASARAMATEVYKRLDDVGVRLQDAAPEVVFIWREGDAWMRSMLDAFDRKSGIIYDVKTTEGGLSDGAIQRQIVNLGYDTSAGFYMRGVSAVFPELAGRLRFRWIFVEAREPHEVRVIEADPMTLAIGERKADFAIRKWQHCMATGDWPGYPPRIDTVEYAPWAEAAWLNKEIADAREF